MKKILAGIGALTLATAAYGYQVTAAGTITSIGSGWYTDSIWVQTTAPALSTSCTYNTPYTTDPASADRKTHHAMLLTAQAMNKAVSIVVDGCNGAYPKIVGVTIQN